MEYELIFVLLKPKLPLWAKSGIDLSSKSVWIKMECSVIVGWEKSTTTKLFDFAFNGTSKKFLQSKYRYFYCRLNSMKFFFIEITTFQEVNKKIRGVWS